MTYGIVSDLHAHAWSTFSRPAENGVNSRLQLILDELVRAAATVKAAGGNVLVIAGDIFHVRGTIDPEVLNPMQDAIRTILDMGVNIYAIPGNHDLKTKNTTALSSAIQTLAETRSAGGNSMVVFNDISMQPIGDGTYLAFVPWHSKTDELLEEIDTLAQLAARSGVIGQTDLIIHAGIEGVLPNMPKSGLTDDVLGAFGFRNVFAGHYHNHKTMQHNVHSIGATTHQTWSDVDSKAGFLLVSETGVVTYNSTHAPQFVDLSGMDEMEMELACDGNYVRFRGAEMSISDVNELRTHFIKWGALGTSIEVPKAAVSARTGTAATPGQSLDQSVQNYVDGDTTLPAHIDREELKRRAAETLAKARMVFDEA